MKQSVDREAPRVESFYLKTAEPDPDFASVDSAPAEKSSPTMVRPRIESEGDRAGEDSSVLSEANVMVERSSSSRYRNRTPIVELMDIIVGNKEAETQPEPTPKADEPAPKFYHKILGVTLGPILYALALSGRQWKTGSMKPPDGEDGIDWKYVRAGLHPLVLVLRAVQGVVSPASALGKGIDVVVDSIDGRDTDPDSTVLGYNRSIFGYAANAVDSVARVFLSPLAGTGWALDKMGPGVNKALNIKERGWFDDIERQDHHKFYAYIGNAAAVATRTVFGLQFALGKVNDLVAAKIGKPLGVDVDVRFEEDGKTLRPETYWKSVRKGIKLSLQAPFGVPLAPFSALSILTDNIIKRVSDKKPERRDYWEHGGRGLLRTGEALLASPAAPVAGIGKVAEIGLGLLKPLSEKLGFEVEDIEVGREGDSLRKKFWKYTGFGLLESLAFVPRIVGSPFAFGSLAADKIKQARDPDAKIHKDTYFGHMGRGLARTLEGAASLPASPLAVYGKVLTTANDKLASWVGFHVDRKYEDKRSFRKKFWSAVGDGVVETIKLPVRAFLSPLAAVSASYNLSKRAFKLDKSRLDRNMDAGFWRHATTRGLGLTLLAPFTVAGSVISGITKGAAKLIGKDLPADKTLWGHDRSWAGYGTSAVDTVGRVAGATFAGLYNVLTWQGKSAQGTDEKESRSDSGFYEKAFKGVAMAVALVPAIAPMAVVGAIGKVFGAAPASDKPDKSIMGLAKDGWALTARGMRAMFGPVAEYAIKQAKVFGEFVKRNYQTVAEATRRFIEKIEEAMGGSKKSKNA